MSSTSSSWRSSLEPHSAHSAGAVSATVMWPSGQYQTGIRCPHQIWREMHHGRTFSSQSRQTREKRSGVKRTRPSLTAATRRRGQLLHRAPPLEHDQRLDAGVAALAGADRVAVRLAAVELPALLQPREHARAGLLLRQAGEVAGLVVHPAVGADHRELRELVVAPDLEVGRVVPRCHLERARAELRLDALVRDHRHAPLDVRHDDFLADRSR